MNKHWKNVILVLTLIVGVLAMSMTTQAAGKGKYFASGKLYYHTLSKNTVEVCATKQTTGILTIPASVSYKGTKYKVVKIADYKFGGESVPVSDDTVNGSTPNLNLQGDHTYRYDRVDGKNIPSDVNWLCNSKISKLVLPSTITYIGDGAFSGCKKLKNVEFAKKYKKLTIGSVHKSNVATFFKVLSHIAFLCVSPTENFFSVNHNLNIGVFSVCLVFQRVGGVNGV